MCAREGACRVCHCKIRTTTTKIYIWINLFTELHCIQLCCFFSVVLVVCLPSSASSSVANTPGIVRNTNFRFIDVCKRSASRATSNGTRAKTVPSATYCARHCLADPNCSSFNWKLADRLCELIPRSDQTPVYQNNTDFVHYSPSVCPVRPADSHSCVFFRKSVVERGITL